MHGLDWGWTVARGVIGAGLVWSATALSGGGVALAQGLGENPAGGEVPGARFERMPPASMGVILDDGEESAVVRQVLPGSPADKAGLEAGDRIVGVGEKETASAGDVLEQIRRHRPGEVVRITYVRADKDPVAVDVTLGARGAVFGGLDPLGTPGAGPVPAAPRAWMGLGLQDAVPDARLPDERGAQVSRVYPGGPADKGGLKVGDVLLRVENQELKSAEDLMKAMQSREPGDTIEIRYRRGQDEAKTTITLGDRTTVEPQRPEFPGGIESPFGGLPFVDPQRRIENLERQVEELRKELEALRKELRSTKGAE